MTREEIIRHVEGLLANRPTQEAVDWLADGFARHLAGEPLVTALGIPQACPQGLRKAIQVDRFSQRIAEAARCLPELSSSHAKAVVIASALRRLGRTSGARRAAPADRFDAALLAAAQIYGGHPPFGVTTIADALSRSHGKRRLHSVDRGVQTNLESISAEDTTGAVRPS